ncbi:hypothetical protein V8B97DRAFT_1868667 [Scleroderma yunnanense]
MDHSSTSSSGWGKSESGRRGGGWDTGGSADTGASPGWGTSGGGGGSGWDTGGTTDAGASSGWGTSVSGWNTRGTADTGASPGWGTSVGGWNTGGTADTGASSGWGNSVSGWNTGGTADTDASSRVATKSSSGSGWATSAGWDTGDGSSGGTMDRNRKEDGGEGSSTPSAGNAGGWGSSSGVSPAGSKTDSSWGPRKPLSGQDARNDAGGWGQPQPLRPASPVGPVSYGTAWGTDTTESHPHEVPPKVDATDKGKGRADAPSSPRLDQPSSRKMTGTNQVPLGTKTKWGDSFSGSKSTPHLDTNISGDTSTTLRVKTSDISSMPPPPARSYSVIEQSDTPLTPAVPSLPPRSKRKREVLDEKYDTFKEYVKTVERAVRARFHLHEAEINRDRWYRTQKSSCYARIGDKGIDILEEKRAEFDKEYFAQREKLHMAVGSLVEYHHSITSGIDLGQRCNISEETNRFIAECKVYTDQISTLIEDFKNRGVPMRDPSPMQIEQASSPSSDEWQILQRRVEEMEESLEQMDAELTMTRPVDVKEIVDKIFDRRLTKLHEARKQEVQKMAQESPPQIVIPPECLQKLEDSTRQWQQVEAKLPKAVEDIRNLILGNAQLTSRLEQLEKENVTYRETLAKLQEKYAAMEELRRQKEKLQTDLDEFMHRLRPEPMASPEDACHRLVEELRPAIDALVQKFYDKEVAPSIKAMGDTLVETSNHKQTELFRVMWQTMEPAMNMVEGVSRWLDSQELSRTAPHE